MLQSGNDANLSGPQVSLLLPESVLQDMPAEQPKQYHRQRALFASQHKKLQEIVTLQYRMTGTDPLTVELPPRQAAHMPVEKAVLATLPQQGWGQSNHA